MVHNNGDAAQVSAKPMSAYFENTLFNADAPKWNLQSWIPDIVVVALGTNDFSGAVKPTEAQYSGAYKAFLAKLRGWYPQAQLICLTYAVDAYQQKYVDSIVSQTATAGDKRIRHVHMPALNGSTDLGCDGHPNVKGQQKYADVLIPVVREILGNTSLSRPSPERRSPGTAKTGKGETWRIPFGKKDGRERTDASGRTMRF
jgi:hypothetical protein